MDQDEIDMMLGDLLQRSQKKEHEELVESAKQTLRGVEAMVEAGFTREEAIQLTCAIISSPPQRSPEEQRAMKKAERAMGMILENLKQQRDEE